MYFHNFLCPAPKLEFFHVLGIKLFLTSASNVDSPKAWRAPSIRKLRMLTLLLQQLLFHSMPNPMDTPFSNAVPNNDEYVYTVYLARKHKLAKNHNIHESKRRERSRPSSPKEQLYVVKIGLQRPSSTACAMALIYNGYSDPYEPETKRERAYMAGISSIY